MKTPNLLFRWGAIFAFVFNLVAIPGENVQAAGTVSLTTIGSTYNQDFDSLVSSGSSGTVPTGWAFIEAGTNADAIYAAGTGSSAIGNTYSFGASGSTERALGGLRTGTLISVFGASFTNNTGSFINSLAITYTGEEWRLGTAGRTDQLTFWYSTNATSLIAGTWTPVAALNFTTPDRVTAGAKDGNAAGERTALSATISGLSIANGGTFWIRWQDADATGADDGLAIDDFSLTPLLPGVTKVTNVTSTIANGTYTTGAVIPIAIIFSEPVNVTGIPQLTLETGVTARVSNYSSGSGTNTLTFNYTVQPGDTSSDLDYVAATSLALNGGTIRDAAINNATLTLASPAAPGSLGFNKAIVIDTLAPTVAISSAASNPTNTSPIPVTVQFSETVAGFTATDVTATNGAVNNFVAVDGDTYTFDLTPAGQGLVTANIAAGVATDTAGNSNTAAAQFSRTYDSLVPTVVMSSAASSPTNVSPIPVIVHFSEDVTGFITTDITATNGTVNNFTPVDGDTYTFDLTPSGQGTVAADIAAGVAQDFSGRPNTAATQFSRTYDDVSPDTTITGYPTNPTSSNSTSFTFIGSDVGGTGVASYQCALDVPLFGACPANYDNLADGSHTFQVRAVDHAGNTDPTPASYTWTVDTGAPSVVVSSATTSPTNDPTFSVTVTFSESVTGFTPSVASGDLVITNGTGSNPGGAGTTYTFDLTPSGEGPVTVLVPAGSGQDTTGNWNTISNVLNINYDSVGPTVTIEQAAGQIDPTSASPVNFTATFNESVTGFANADVSVGGMAGATTVSVNGGPAIYNLEVSGMTGGGTVNVSIAAGVAFDTAGNGNAAPGIIDNEVMFTPLAITSPNNINFVAGNPSSFTVTTAGAPAPTITYTGTLPSGVTFTNNGDGTATLAGIPAPSSVGPHNLTFIASNGVASDATQSFTLTIAGPPGVSLINSFADTGDGQVLENEHMNAAITQLLVVFNKEMNADTPADPDDALNIENYILVRDGSPDNLVNSVTYDGPTHTATLGITAPVPLPNGRYTLTISGAIEDTLDAPIGTNFVRNFFVDSSAPALIGVVTLPNAATITNGATIGIRFSSIDITFNEDVNNPALDTNADDVTNPQNYLLLARGPNGTFDTPACTIGRTGDDIQIPIGPVTYNNHAGNGPFVATVQLNGGTALENGTYRLFICGTTSIVDPAGNRLNNGLDEQRTFNVLVTIRSNPQTGFAPGKVTVLPEQPAEKAYTDLGNLWIEIPGLKLKTSITGVPLKADGWDVTWLHWQVGWLEGTAYPTWEGNTVLTAHGYTADGEAGPFALLKNLSYGQTFIIHLGGMKYTYAVRTNVLISPNDTRWLTRHETLDWVTLITCQQYDAKTRSYRYRRVVRAVLVSVEKE